MDRIHYRTNNGIIPTLICWFCVQITKITYLLHLFNHMHILAVILNNLRGTPFYENL